jgi:hypothetical protein
VSDRVGHASGSITQRIYPHQSAGQDQPAADLIGRMIREQLGEPLLDDNAPEAC